MLLSMLNLSLHMNGIRSQFSVNVLSRMRLNDAAQQEFDRLKKETAPLEQIVTKVFGVLTSTLKEAVTKEQIACDVFFISEIFNEEYSLDYLLEIFSYCCREKKFDALRQLLESPKIQAIDL
ncbi:MAG TPA: hypothetical protein VLF61_02295, partial [Rhabdochlamydiaceae bacterium]|nr:hypothetical protein [Rhabdochlamydiaceae bacterium]